MITQQGWMVGIGEVYFGGDSDGLGCNLIAFDGGVLWKSPSPEAR